MSLTLEAIDSISTEGNIPEWTFGGGTALALDLQHRVSYDIDAFMDSAKAIRELVPVRNEVTRAMCWNPETQRSEFHWPGHYLKLFIHQKGEIDFLGASSLIENPTVNFEIFGRSIERERPAEIIAKKIYHRGATFKGRDIFDLAGTYLTVRDELLVAAQSPFLTPTVLQRVRTRLAVREAEFVREIIEETNPTDFGESYIADALQLAHEALDFMQNRPAVENGSDFSP